LGIHKVENLLPPYPLIIIQTLTATGTTPAMTAAGTTAAGGGAALGTAGAVTTSRMAPVMTTAPAATTAASIAASAGVQGGFMFGSVVTGGLQASVVSSMGSPAMVSFAASMPTTYAASYPGGPGGSFPFGYGYGSGFRGGVIPVPGHSHARGCGIVSPGVKEISTKPPVMKGSFDLFAVQLKTYLTRLSLWGVVDGSEARPLFDVEGQAAFDARDNAARDAILRGIPDADAEMACHESSARDMWVSFENKQTKREYANYIFAREQLYSNKYTRDLNLSDWLRDMELQRRELQHYGKVISDEEFAEILLGNVSRTHREVVRQFSRHYAVLAVPGTHQMAPTAAQVMNALRAEEDLDERVAEELPQASIGSAKRKSVNSSGSQKAGNSGKGGAGNGKRQRGRGRYKAKAKNQDGKSAGGGKKKNDGCWNCGEPDHIRANCPNPKQSDTSQGQKQCAGMEAKRFQSKKGGNAGGAQSIDALTQRHIGAAVINSRRSKSCVMEWVLDTATDVHVCTDATLLANSRPDKEHIFLDFDGQPKGERVVGEVRLLVTNVTLNHDEELMLHGVVHTPTGPDNLLSSHQLEESGWNVSFTQTDDKRVCWLEKDGMKLSLAKTRGRYRLQAKPAEDREVSAVSRTPATAVRWHLRFAHLNYPALRQMAVNETVVGLDELRGDASCSSGGPEGKCWTCTASKLKRLSYKQTHDVSHLLSMEIKYVPGQSISISQRGYIGRILERFKMADCKAMPTPQAKGNFPLPGDPDREAVCVNIDPDVDY
jgi:hypothetical protein